MLLGKFDGVYSSSMGAGSILCGYYDRIRVALSVNQDSSDEPVISRRKFVFAEDENGTS